MSAILIIARRELASFFRTSIGWVVIALYLLVCGFFVAMSTLKPGEPATLRAFFGVGQWLLLFVAPAVSMRLVSEELRTGTIEPLMTSPLSDWQIVVGKYLGAVGFLLVMLGCTLVYPAVLEALSAPDYGPILAGYLGLVLVGMLYLAVGLLASACTPNQVVALLATFFFFLILEFGTTQAARALGPPWDAPLYACSIFLRLGDFAKGVIDTAHIVFFLSASAFFVVLAVVAVESRRWR